MSRKSLSSLPNVGPSRSPSKRSSIGSINSNVNAHPPSIPIDPQREQALIDACTRGDATAASAALAQIQDQQTTGQQRSMSRELEELVGYAFACAAGGNHVHVLELLLLASGPAIRQSLTHGICREAWFFAPRAFFHCCFALRYAAFAAVLSIEQRALASLEWLTALHPCKESEEVQSEDYESEEGLLMDVDVMRCFRLAFTLTCGSFATSSATTSASQPEQFRPLLMVLLSRYPTLLLPVVHSAQPIDVLLLASLSDVSGRMDPAVIGAAQALRSSLLYEYMTNTK